MIYVIKHPSPNSVKKAAKLYRDEGRVTPLLRLIPTEDLGGELVKVSVPDEFRYVNCRGKLGTLKRWMDRDICDEFRNWKQKRLVAQVEIETIDLRVMIPGDAVEYVTKRARMERHSYYQTVVECAVLAEYRGIEDNPEDHRLPVWSKPDDITFMHLPGQSFTGEPVPLRVRMPSKIAVEFRLFCLQLHGTMEIH